MTAIVLPSSGFKWGEYWTTAKNNYPGYQARQYAIGRQFDISSWFTSFDSLVSDHGEFLASAQAGQNVLVAWQPNKTTGITFANLLAGTYDAHINSWIDFFQTFPNTVYIRFGHEMNGNYYPWNPTYNGSSGPAANTTTITNVSSGGSSPTTVTVASTTALVTGQQVNITGLVGTPTVSGAYSVTVVDSTHFTIPVANSVAYVSGGVVQWSPQCINVAQYISAWQYMYNRAVSRATTNSVTNNIRWVFCMNQNDTGTNGGVPAETFYPGDAYVDVLGFDSYDTLNGLFMTPQQTFSGYTNNSQATAYSRLVAMNTGTAKDIWCCETGVVDVGDSKDTTHTAVTGAKATFYTNTFAMDTSVLPRLKAIVWFDTSGNRNWVHDTTAAAFNAFVSPTTGFLQGAYIPAPVPVGSANQPAPWAGYDLPGPEVHVYTPDPTARDQPREHSAIWHWLNQIITKVNGWAALSGDTDGTAPAASLFTAALGTATTGVLQIRSYLTGTKRAISLGVTGDANEKFALDMDGKQQWGVGGGTSLDTNLYRAGTQTLATDQNLTVGKQLNLTQDIVQANMTAPTRPAAGTGTIGYSTADGLWVAQVGKAWQVRPRPSDANNRLFALDPEGVTGAATLTVGSPFYIRFWVPDSRTLTNMGVDITVAGAGLVSCFLGVTDGSGNLLGATADQSSAWQATGEKRAALVAGPGSLAVTPGYYFAVILVGSGSTTSPTLRGNFTCNPNWNLSAGNSARALTNGGSLTAIPATATLSSGALQSKLPFVDLL